MQLIISSDWQEMRARISENTKYFCATENIADYLQNSFFTANAKVFWYKETPTSPIISIMKSTGSGTVSAAVFRYWQQ
ncbi:MAG: hypothetical protein U0T81_04805 [Saprospiraceae bacterium]